MFSSATTASTRHVFCSARRWFHQTTIGQAVTVLKMPAMSPTMTEGGIASWKKLEGDHFTAGEVLLEIETDKATIDVEAQDDGIMAKILLPDGSKNVPVGKHIAVLAEEGDDITNVSVPVESTEGPKAAATEFKPPATKSVHSEPAVSQHMPTPTHTPTHLRPLFPSVYRLLTEYSITNPSRIQGTGVRGMLTKGDVLAFLGKASSPTGTFKDKQFSLQETSKTAKQDEAPVLDGASLRRLIVSGMMQSPKARTSQLFLSADFDAVIDDYLPGHSRRAPEVPFPSSPSAKASSYLDGLL